MTNKNTRDSITIANKRLLAPEGWQVTVEASGFNSYPRHCKAHVTDSNGTLRGIFETVQTLNKIGLLETFKSLGFQEAKEPDHGKIHAPWDDGRRISTVDCTYRSSIIKL